MKGVRADIRLVEQGLAQSREKARALIMAGVVYNGMSKIEKAGESVAPDVDLTVKEAVIPFVSRGGLKLDKAIKKYSLSLDGVVAADVGASTGGFTDCMLQAGAKKVYAIDVGYGQLDWHIRNDERVVVMERTNARNMQPDWFEEKLEFASIDVSFISIKLILPALKTCLADNAIVTALVKPQFEAGRAKIGKNGVVRDPATHEEVLGNIIAFATGLGFHVEHMDFSPITGPKGNIEFLLILYNGDNNNNDKNEISEENIVQIVAEAHKILYV